MILTSDEQESALELLQEDDALALVDAGEQDDDSAGRQRLPEARLRRRLLALLRLPGVLLLSQSSRLNQSHMNMGRRPKLYLFGLLDLPVLAVLVPADLLRDKRGAALSLTLDPLKQITGEH